MTTTQDLHKLGQSLWLDNITRGILDDGTLAPLHRRAVGHRPHLEPDHFRRGDRRLRAVRREHPAEGARRRCRARRCSSSWRSRICAAPPTCSGPEFDRTDGIDGWVSMEVSPLLANDTRATHRGGASSIHKLADRPNLYVKIPGTPAGRSRHRGGHLRRRAGQRHAAVLPRAIPRRRGGVHARHRAAHRRQARSAGELRRVALRQPLGPGRRRQGACGAAPTGWESPSRDAPTARIAT